MSMTLPSPAPHAPAVDAPIPPAVPSPNEKAPTLGEMFVTLENVDWDLYEAIDRSRGDSSRPLLIYSKGKLTLVSPLLHHDLYEEFLGALILAVCEEMDIPCMPAGSTTFRRKDLKIGVEGDRTFYLAHEPRIHGRVLASENIELEAGDPPPDLVIEIELTHSAGEALAIWEEFGTPEVWVYRPRQRSLIVMLRGTEGRYAESTSSLAFPFLEPAEVVAWLDQVGNEPINRWMRRLRTWVRDVLVPRVKGNSA